VALWTRCSVGQPLLRAVDADDRAVGDGDAIERFGWYLLHVNDTPAEDVHMALEKHLQRREENFMSTAEKLRREGHAEGKVEGKVEGAAEGRSATLLRLLTRRFGPLPPHVEPRLRSATPAELDRFTDRVLDAPTLDAVFAAE
jgi:hypothetical protein